MGAEDVGQHRGAVRGVLCVCICECACSSHRALLLNNVGPGSATTALTCSGPCLSVSCWVYYTTPCRKAASKVHISSHISFSPPDKHYATPVKGWPRKHTCHCLCFNHIMCEPQSRHYAHGAANFASSDTLHLLPAPFSLPRAPHRHTLTSLP